MPATFSPEGRIDAGLRELGCSGRNFVDIAKNLNVRIAQGPFSEALSGKKPFDTATAEKLLVVLDRMRDLQESVGVAPIGWAMPQRVAVALTIRLASTTAAEFDDHDLDRLAAETTKRLQQ